MIALPQRLNSYTNACTPGGVLHPPMSQQDFQLSRLALLVVLVGASLAPRLCAQSKAHRGGWTEQQKARMAERVRRDFQHAWRGYMKYAWGHDALKPLSNSYRDWYSAPTHAKAARVGDPGGTPLLMTPVDGLDTM